MKLEIISQKPGGNADKVPLLFIHGMFHGAWCWKENFLPFFVLKGYPCYALSLRGHGKSEIRKNVRWATVNEYLEDIHTAVVKIMEETGKLPVLVGHSTGGNLAQLYLNQNSASGLILLSSGPPWGWMPLALRILKRTPLLFFNILMHMDVFIIVKTPALFKKAYFFNIQNKKLLNFYKLISQDSIIVFLQLIFYKFASVKKIKCPVGVFAGEKDKIFPPVSASATAKVYGAEVFVFENIGHELMVEDGWENVADSMLKWLKKQGL